MTKEKTIFQEIAEGATEAHILAQNEHAMAILDIYPQTKGHTLIITKKPFQDITQVPNEELASVYQLVQKVVIAIKKALNVDDILVKSHNGKLAGQEIMHFHVHIIPCYDKNSRFNSRRKASKEELKEIQETITSHLT